MRTTSRKAFSYVCRIGVSFDASGSPLTRSAGCHPLPLPPPPFVRSTLLSHPAARDPFCPFSCHRARRSSFARHVRRMNDNLRVLDSPLAGKSFFFSLFLSSIRRRDRWYPRYRDATTRKLMNRMLSNVVKDFGEQSCAIIFFNTVTLYVMQKRRKLDSSRS